jgi:RNA polymerase primary sigma factor
MDPIKTYLKELKNLNSTNDESLKLLALYRENGDVNAKDRLAKNHLLLVVKKAREYMNKGVPLADLISEGNVGLLIAIEKFDTTTGATFSSYAQKWIKANIIRNCMHKKGVVRLPENVSELMRTDRWEGPNFRETSIDAKNDEGDSMAETIADKDYIEDMFSDNEEANLMKRKVEKILSFLKGRDADIVKACYGIGQAPVDVEEAAELFELTTTRINQILRNSLKTMRISHESLPESKAKEVEIVSAKYGSDDAFIDVTDKVTDMYMKKDNIKSSNRLGGDPCPGIVKFLIVQYIYEDKLLSKTISEGSFLKF